MRCHSPLLSIVSIRENFSSILIHCCVTRSNLLLGALSRCRNTPSSGTLCAPPILGDCSIMMQRSSIRPVNSKLCSMIQPFAEMSSMCHSISSSSMLPVVHFASNLPVRISAAMHKYFTFRSVHHCGILFNLLLSPQSKPWCCFIKQAAVVASIISLLSRIIIKM